MPVDPAEAYALFSRDYFYMALLASLGTLQLAVTFGGYRGLYMLPWRNASRVAGVLLLVASVLYFFLSPLWIEGPWAAGSVAADSATREWGTASWGDLGQARNVNDVDGGLSGGGQAVWFPAATGIALVISIAAGFVGLKLRGREPGHVATDSELDPSPGADGLDALRDGDFQGALGQSVGSMRATFRRDAITAWNSAPSWTLPKLIAKRLGR